MYETPSFLLFLAGSWFNCQCSCYNFHFIVFFVPQSSFDVPNLVLSVLFLTHPKFVFCIVPFLWTYNVPSSFFFYLVPKILNCICLADLLALFLFSSTIFVPMMWFTKLFVSCSSVLTKRIEAQLALLHDRPTPIVAPLQTYLFCYLLMFLVSYMMFSILNVSLLNVTQSSLFCFCTL